MEQSSKELLKIELQTQPDGASCFVTALAMVMGVPVLELIEEIGIDHREILHPGKPGALKYRGHHIQDVLEAVINHGWCIMTMYKKYSVSHLFFNKRCIACGGTGKFKGVMVDGNLLMKGNVGILQYGNHMCAWDGKLVYNPVGRVEEFHTTRLIGFHPMFRIQQHDISNG